MSGTTSSTTPPPGGSGSGIPLPPLAAIARTLAAALDAQEAMHRITQGALEITRAQGAYVEQVIAPDLTVEVVSAIGAGVPRLGTRVPYPGSLTEEILEGQGPVALAEIGKIGSSISPYLTESCEGCSALVAPLIADGRVIGTLVLLRTRDSSPFSKEDAEQARLLSDFASVSLRRILLLQETDRERREKTALLESTGEGIYGIDQDGRCTFLNRAGARILGYSPDEVLGANMHQLIHHSRADGTPYPEAECPIFRASQGCEAVRVDTEVLWRKDGTSFAAEYSSSPIVENGVTSGAVVTFADITARRAAEETLRLRNRAIAEVNEGILITDPHLPDNPIIYVNPSFERLTGYSAQEVIGKNCRFLQGPDTDPAAVAQIREAIREGSPVTVELLNYCRNGTAFWNRLSISPVHDDEGRIAHFVGVQDDITERRRAEQERDALLESERTARADAENAVRIRDEVLGIVSHDLRNPLNTILMSSSMMLEMPLKEEQRVKQLEIIMRSVERMNRLIQDLLDVARIEAGRLSIACHILSPALVAREAYEAFHPLATDKGIDLQLDVVNEPPKIGADHDRISQVLSNLLGNALKFTGSGGRIAIRVEEADRNVRFSVQDTGPGIAQDDLPQLFNAYWQAKRTAHLGAGLGLAISQGIVKAHGGDIGVESELGKGSTFFFTIPVLGGAGSSST